VRGSLRPADIQTKKVLTWKKFKLDKNHIQELFESIKMFKKLNIKFENDQIQKMFKIWKMFKCWKKFRFKNCSNMKKFQI
jgi:hypothetical protein